MAYMDPAITAADPIPAGARAGQFARLLADVQALPPQQQADFCREIASNGLSFSYGSDKIVAGLDEVDADLRAEEDVAQPGLDAVTDTSLLHDVVGGIWGRPASLGVRL